MMHTLFIMLALYSYSPRFSPMVLTRPLSPGMQPLYQDFPLEPIDVLHYDLSIAIDRNEKTIDAIAGVTLVPTEEDLQTFRLYLKQLTVTAVDGAESFFHDADSLFITLPSPVSSADTVLLTVHYSGTPPEESWGGFHFHAYVTYHMGVGFVEDPSMGKYMFPCHDRPSDKATFDFHITVPDDLYAVASGDSAGVTDNMDGTLTYHWTLAEPMSTYLAALSVADYAVLHDSTDARIFYYVYSWDIDDALGSFVNVDLMMARFEEVYGPYPWNCKFSFVQTPLGDMEHVSQVYHFAAAINGTTYYDWLLAHEMAHHWWGNCVTEEVWSDVWLSEGFATFSEAVWMEHYGPDAYLDYMVTRIMKPYLNSGELFPITNPQTPGELWSATTYKKAGSVLHMLRQLLGDEPFYAALATYFDAHSYGTATTDDLKSHLEAQYGGPLDWFFDSWLHGPGYPIYDNGYQWVEQGGAWELSINVSQTQTVDNFFIMPVEYLVQGAEADTLVSFWNDVNDQQETFMISFEPVSVHFDPSVKILNPQVMGTGESVSPPPGGVSTMFLGPNPAVSSTVLNWPGTDDLVLSVRIYDMSGRVVREDYLAPGNRSMTLNGMAAGTYIVDAKGENGIRQAARLVILSR